MSENKWFVLHWRNCVQMRASDYEVRSMTAMEVSNEWNIVGENLTFAQATALRIKLEAE